MDMDPGTGADIIGNMLDIPLEPESVDAVYTCHTLEHVTQHDGKRALAEFLRVVKPGGMVVVIVPNIGHLGDLISRGKLYDTLYDSPGGHVCAADMLYGHQGLIERDRQHKAYRFQHKFGYTPETLGKAFEDAGFKTVRTGTINTFDAVCAGIK